MDIGEQDSIDQINITIVEVVAGFGQFPQVGDIQPLRHIHLAN